MRWFNEKKIFLCIAMIFIIFSAPLHLSASELDHEAVNTEKIKLKLTYATVRISSEEFYIRSETENSAKVDVFDKKSGQIVETYGEIIEETESLAKSTGTNSIVTTYTERTDGPSINRIVSRLTVKMNIFTSGSFRQINSVLSTSLATVNSNLSTIEDIDTVVIPSSSDFPSTGISANGTGVVTTKATFSTKLELEAGISKYKEVNFAITLSGGVSFDFYARKPIELALNYSLY